ncbi:uncharacterized protein [Amphiura filiformis]|uniref:uncharacterized protein n=1 Tax=Amphiura filiformis TaxID=82378 RepID=UPI003B21A7C0
MALGIPGNALILCAYSMKQFRTSAHIFIMGLALVDLLICLLRPLDIFLSTPKGLDYEDNYDYWCRGQPVIFFTLNQWSVFITAAIAVDRYVVVCRPHNHAITPTRAKIIIAVSLLVSFVVYLPTAFHTYRVDTYLYGGLYYIGKQCNPTIGPLWFLWLQKVIAYAFTFTSLGLMIVLYANVIIEVRRRTKIRPAGLPGTSAGHFADAGSTIMVPINSASGDSEHEQGQDTAAGQSVIRQQCGGPDISDGTAMVSKLPKDSDQAKQTDNNLRCKTISATVAGRPGNSTARVTKVTSGSGKTTKMLLLTTAIFVSTYIPALVYYLIPYHILFNMYFSNRQLLALCFVMNKAFLFNHAINPFIYGFINKRFREDCAKVIKRLKCY